jgi:hypothetical protein
MRLAHEQGNKSKPGVQLETGDRAKRVPNRTGSTKFVGERLRAIPGVANIESFIGLDLYERKFELGIIH